MNPFQPTHSIAEAELHAYVDARLPLVRRQEIEDWLVTRPDEVARLESYRLQKRGLREMFDPILQEQVPHRLLSTARRRVPWYAQRLAAGLAVALISGGIGWSLHGGLPMESLAAISSSTSLAPISLASAAGFAQRAAIAHAVYSPDQRRPVEVDAAHEDQLVSWLSNPKGAPMKPPHLQTEGYSLEGGRLLPGGQGPVAQFMYQDAEGRKLTLYVSNEVADVESGEKNSAAAFKFTQQGSLKVFYWVDGPFGYAISADTDRDSLTRVAAEVHRQLTSVASTK